jgi:hypothetical protein
MTRIWVCRIHLQVCFVVVVVVVVVVVRRSFFSFLGDAFKDVAIDDAGLYPACSLNPDNEVRFNFRAENFKFAPEKSWSSCKPYALAVSEQ